jgi:hypothetical protein
MYARRLFAGALLLSQAACMTVQNVTPPVKYIEANGPDQVWITTSNGTQSLVYRPKIFSDSIFGFDAKGQQLTLPVEIVQAARVKTLDRGKTFMAGGAFAAVAGGAVYILAKNASASGSKKCEGSAGNAVCEGKANTTERHNAGVSIPVNTATKLVGGIARALLGN